MAVPTIDVVNQEGLITILHLSDLHFGWDGDERGRTDRDLALKGLLRQLRRVEPEWKPEVVCVTGDIGWKGQTSDYVEAGRWLGEVLDLLGLSPEALFLCPGNHDSNRTEAQLNPRPTTSAEADERLVVPIPESLELPFQAFSDFSRNMNVPAYRLGDVESFAVGYRSYRGLKFVSHNSAWYSQGNDDKDRLWVGANFIKLMESRGQLPHPSDLAEHPPTIALMHHPREWFHEEELHSYAPRPSTFEYLVRRCHLLLTGHTHDAPRPADKFAEAAWHLSGGAAYAGANHFNSFRLIRVEDGRFVYRTFEYDPRSSDNNWRQVMDARPIQIQFKKEGTSGFSSGLLGEEHNGTQSALARWREDAAADAERYVVMKSRALKGRGQLPGILPRKVSLQVKGIRQPFDTGGRLLADLRPDLMTSLLEASGRSRRTFLLGDLGTGKSTLAGEFVGQAINEGERALAFLLPAKSVKSEQISTLKDLLAAAAEYFSKQISPASHPIDIGTLLNEKIKLTLVLDGLDEVSLHHASALLNRLSQLVESWPDVNVVATARPVELRGVSYEEWQVLVTAPLSEEEKYLLFEKEALAGGHGVVEAKDVAARLLQKLRTFPNLYTLASSPLVVRLLYPKLLAADGEMRFTLGDLLYDLIKERLGQWTAKDNKQTPAARFAAEYPDELSRVTLFSQLALGLGERRAMPAEEARRRLESLVRSSGATNSHVLAEEALQFLSQSGVAVIDEELEFSLQPFFEVLCGFGLAIAWQSAPEAVSDLDDGQWRKVSFAATAVRRLGLIESLRPQLIHFIERLLSVRENVPAAAYVVAESRDRLCAEAFVSGSAKLGLRPLTLISVERRASARVIAEAIKLAGRMGFDWFFDSYLDPRYPITNWGSGYLDQIFEQWAFLSLDGVTERERERLKTMIMPHVQAGTAQLIDTIPLVALLIPEEFELEDRLWYTAASLGDEFFTARAERLLEAAYDAGHDTVVNDTLVRHAQKGVENAAFAACIWLKLNGNERPPTEIMKALVHAYGSPRPYLRFRHCIEQCAERVGKQRWEEFLWDSLNDRDDHLSAGTALCLLDMGRGNLASLGKALLKALHDGAYVRRAEEHLSRLVHDGGEEAVVWLAGHIARMDRNWGGHSGWWRIFLAELPRLGDRGPQLLASCVGAIDYLLLPRRPEVRQAFRNLLGGPQGQEYWRTLRSLLNGDDGEKRYGAAMILVASEPGSESQALEIVVRQESPPSDMSRHEWLSFCLTLSFGPSVLTNLQSKLPTLDAPAEDFALAILNRNGIQLDDRQRERLIQGLSARWNYGLDSADPKQRVVAQGESFEALVKTAKGGVKEHATGAARNLIEHHASKLSPALYARCAALAIPNMGPWGLAPLREQLLRMEADPSYANAVKEAADEIIAQGGERPLLDVIREAVVDEQAWEEVLLRMFDPQPFKSGTDYEDDGQWFLDLGKLAPKYKRAIGNAAVKLLCEERIKYSYRGEGQQWLAIIADEFVGVPKEILEWALHRGNVIRESATAVILARLGEVPSGFKRRRGVASRP
jgi:predicted MPP superfamily phosphohydrolase